MRTRVPNNTIFIALAFLVSLSTVPFLTKLVRNCGLCLFNKPTHNSISIRSFSMAWQSSGATNEALITNLERNKLIGSDRVKEAMLKV